MLLGLYFVSGLNVGAIFINVINLIKTSQKLVKSEKELAINVAVLTRDVLSLAAMLVSLFLSLTVFVKYTANQD